MKTYIEDDRIRLVAENDDDNDAILSLIDLFAATGYPDDGLANESVVHNYGCLSGKNLNYCCIPLPEDAEAHAIRTGHLNMGAVAEHTNGASTRMRKPTARKKKTTRSVPRDQCFQGVLFLPDVRKWAVKIVAPAVASRN